jgi:hypothetical protein
VDSLTGLFCYFFDEDDFVLESKLPHASRPKPVCGTFNRTRLEAKHSGQHFEFAVVGPLLIEPTWN